MCKLVVRRIFDTMTFLEKHYLYAREMARCDSRGRSGGIEREMVQGQGMVIVVHDSVPRCGLFERSKGYRGL